MANGEGKVNFTFEGGSRVVLWTDDNIREQIGRGVGRDYAAAESDWNAETATLPSTVAAVADAARLRELDAAIADNQSKHAAAIVERERAVLRSDDPAPAERAIAETSSLGVTLKGRREIMARQCNKSAAAERSDTASYVQQRIKEQLHESERALKAYGPVFCEAVEAAHRQLLELVYAHQHAVDRARQSQSR